MTNYISKTAQLFAVLLEKGSVSASSVDRGSPEIKQQFARLDNAGIVKKQRSGGGNCYRLLHPDKLQSFIDADFPSGLIRPEDSDSANRTFGVLTRGNSKTVSTLGFDIMMIRGNAELMVNQQRHLLDNSDSAFLSLKISKEQKITLLTANSRIVTIENPTVFTELNKIADLQWDIAIYTAGKMSTLLLDQLQLWQEAGHTLIHFGDYDYVGLLEYARILQRCPLADIYFPTRLTHQFIEKYGTPELHQKQIAQHESLLKKLETLPASAQKKNLIGIHKLLQSTSQGLEQEAFLKPSKI